MQLVVNRAFLGYFVVDVKHAFLSYFVIDVAIILFNGRGFMIFTWRNLFLFTVIIFHRYFCLLIFLMHVFLHRLRLSKNSRGRHVSHQLQNSRGRPDLQLTAQ